MSAEFNWFPGHMNKTLKEIEKRIPVVDLVIEIVDARAPYSSQNLTFRKILKNKPVLYVLSKGDLADPSVTKLWIEHFKSNGHTVFLLDDRNKNIVKDLIKAIDQATIIKQEKDKSRGLVNSLINALVIGVPNVGKSTFINRVIKDKSVKVGNKPGVTRGIQTISLNQRITLMDTPGVLPGKLESEATATNLCGINSIKEEVYPKERVSARLMSYIFNHYEGVVENYFKISPHLQRPIQIADTYILFEMIAKSMKWYLTEDMPDVERVMTVFMRNLANGVMGKLSFEKPFEIVPELIEESHKEKVKIIDGDITKQW
ncbi:ribosome biogenesis GTPase YlqF [[Acholeplasma] multilocale]|uniref:ribosome biogenesis GTPase YlqF n=1 Tax=[Acholeplasma] multilocale TaxID=264638 RepID=UPI00047C202E|nr:ribosome biogenesis GTPase YlqF [[Acholeplasma] multilocale]